MSGRQSVQADFEEDPRYRIASREAWVAVVYWVVYTISITSVAWGIGHGKSADEIRFVLGFPSWFFWSAGVVTLIFCVIPYFLVKYLFVEESLLADPSRAEGPGTGPVGEGRDGAVGDSR